MDINFIVLLTIGFIIVSFLFCAVFVFYNTRVKGISLFDSFILGVTIYTLGAYLINFDHVSVDSIFILSISIYLFIISYVIWFFHRMTMAEGMSYKRVLGVKSQNHLFAWCSFIFLLFVNLLFIYLVYVRIINGYFSGVYALLDIRKTISSGEAGYFAPGLIKQIRDIFGPAFLVWLVLFYDSSKKKWLIYSTFIILLGSMVFGGQRMPVLVLFLSISIAVYYKKRSVGQRLSSLAILTTIVVTLAFLFILNLLLGRASETESVLLSFLDLLGNLLTRIFATVPEENLKIIPFLEQINLPPFSLWLSDLAILLPGKQESLSNQMHSYLGGSSQGNSVLGTPLDIFVNSGYIGLIVVPVLVYLVVRSLQSLLLRQKNPFSTSLFIVFFCYLPFCYSFYIFLLNGGLLVIIYAVYDSLIVRKKLNKIEAKLFLH